MARPKTYDGKDIAISFDMSLCIHSRNCFLKLPQVFDPDRRPWVDPDAVPADEIAAMVRTCPSGALSFTRKDGGAAETPVRSNIAQVQENGPLAMQGDLRLGDRSMTRATLCRCGQSRNKPFCDFSHVEAGFTATGECSLTDKDSARGRGGPLLITPVPDGPIKVEGALDVVTASGRQIARTAVTRLCRCGQSQSKPFCDGSHKAAGFTTED